MTTSTTALMTRLRTWALVAGLTGLVIALGATIGGVFLWLFVAVAVIFNVVGYFHSDRIALRAARARPLPEYDAPEVHAAVRQLADRQRAAALVPVRRRRGQSTRAGRRARGDDPRPDRGRAVAARGLPAAGVPRRRDGRSADGTGIPAGRRAGGDRRIADAGAQVSPVTAPMYIANPLGGGQARTLFSTHPPVSDRVRRLRAYDRTRSREVRDPRTRARPAV